MSERAGGAAEALAGYLRELLAEGPDGAEGPGEEVPSEAPPRPPREEPGPPPSGAAEGLWRPFRVGGLWLALPAAWVGGVARAGEPPAAPPGGPLLHLAPVVYPPGHPGRERPPGPWRLALADGRVLACEEVGEPCRPEGVVWRRERGSRPWLAATAARPRCALLDPQALPGEAEGEGERGAGTDAA